MTDDWDDLPYDSRIHGDQLVDGHRIDFVIDLLMMDNTARELRQMASDLGASRERGYDKRETAGAIAHQMGYRLRVVENEYGEKEVRYE